MAASTSTDMSFSWCQHKAKKTPSICLGAGRTLMYNMTQRVDCAISVNCPDLVVLDKEKQTALLIYVTCPMDIKMVTATAKKHKIQTVPIFIGVLGTLCQNLDTNLAKVSPCTCAAMIQKEVLL
eukprot:64818-Ditylum_brightwellii.AAC.1